MEVRSSIPNLARFQKHVENTKTVEVLGRVHQVTGLIVESIGPNARIGELCTIETDVYTGKSIYAEAIGFRSNKVLLMPLGDLAGIRAGCLVRCCGEHLQIPVGEKLQGRVLDALGHPLDHLGPLEHDHYYPLQATSPNVLERHLIRDIFETGIRAIDGLLTFGIGQRIGIFSGSGIGKSTLLGMIARNGGADVNVIALVGERGREVREFIELDLGHEGMKRTIIVCATSDTPALLRIKAAFSATAIAEYFRDQGLNVMLMMDSMTRLAMAQREVGLALGEPPSIRSYTPSVFDLLPKLVERAGCSSKGSITALYTILMEGDDVNEPIADTARSILDGHIILDRKLTSEGHYPPIDILQSLSRVMPLVVNQEHLELASRFRSILVARRDVEDLISIGAYKSGSQPMADLAINKWERILSFLRQSKNEAVDFQSTYNALREIVDV